MLTAWTKNLSDPGDIERFQNTILGSETVLKRLNELLDEMVDKIDRSSQGLNQYQNPNWGYETAHKNGMVSAYNAVKALVTIKTNNDTI